MTIPQMHARVVQVPVYKGRVELRPAGGEDYSLLLVRDGESVFDYEQAIGWADDIGFEQKLPAGFTIHALPAAEPAAA